MNSIYSQGAYLTYVNKKNTSAEPNGYLMYLQAIYYIR